MIWARVICLVDTVIKRYKTTANNPWSKKLIFSCVLAKYTPAASLAKIKIGRIDITVIWRFTSL